MDENRRNLKGEEEVTSTPDTTSTKIHRKLTYKLKGPPPSIKSRERNDRRTRSQTMWVDGRSKRWKLDKDFMTCHFQSSMSWRLNRRTLNLMLQLRNLIFANAGDRGVILYLHKPISRVFVEKRLEGITLRDCMFIEYRNKSILIGCIYRHCTTSEEEEAFRIVFQRTTNSSYRDMVFFGDFNFPDKSWDTTSAEGLSRQAVWILVLPHLKGTSLNWIASHQLAKAIKLRSLSRRN